MTQRSAAARLWTKTRKLWFKQNPPNEQDGYNCHYCKRYMFPAETTLDHFHPRGSNPKLRYELSNLVPCCWTCNGKKGSIDGDIFVKQSKA